MRLIIEPVWSWPLVILAAAVMLAVVAITYPRQIRHLPGPWGWVLIGLRLLAVATVLFTILRPSIRISEPDRSRSEIAILMDRSRSMSTPDAPGGLTRRESLARTLQSNQETFRKLGEEIDIRLMDFAQDLQPATQVEETADGPLTAIGSALDLLREQSAGDRLRGIVLMSDGAERANEVDPLVSARRLAEERGVPIHTVLFGSSELSTGGLDLAIEDLVLDQSVTFERKTVPVRLQVRLLGASGRDVRVRLLIEDRTGKALGESGTFKEIPLSNEARPFRDLRTHANSAVESVELSFVAEQAGEYKIAAEVVPLEGEVKTNNNRVETLISVRKGGLRVAYFDTLREEQRFIRGLNKTAKIQLDTQFVLSGAAAGRTRLDPKLFAPQAYDAYIIGNVPASVFQSPDNNLLAELAARVKEGAGLAMLGGWENYSSGGYANTPLAAVLPVQLSEGTSDHLVKPIKIMPTAEGRRHYLMRLSGTNSDEAWRELPELAGANRLVPKSAAAEVLAESTDGDPLIIATDTGTARVVALAIDETWKWHMRGYIPAHQRFWQQLVLWLAHKELDSDQPVWVRVDPRNFSPRSMANIEFGAQEDNGTPISDANYQIEVIKPDGTSVPAIPQRSGTGGFAEFTEMTDPGDYWVRVSATKEGRQLGPTAMTRFIVNARDLEMDNPAADPALMDELADMTGGSSLVPEELGDFLESLLQEGIPSDLTRYRRINLWDGWPLLLAFITFLSLEWTIRKAKGLV